MSVDPSAWGWGTTDVPFYTVKAATVRRIRLRAAAECEGWYSLRGGLTPALWDAPPGAPTGSATSNGLAMLRAKWAGTHATRMANATPKRAADWEVEQPLWMQPGK